MKNLIKYTLLVAVALVISCTDDSLDPLNFKSVKKGTLLALRGNMLQRIYVQGKPGAELFPKIATGTEVFAFDAEYLSSDPSSISSFDVFVIRKPTSTTTSRELLVNVPASQFKNDGKYPNPWVSVSTTSAAILAKLGITFPLSAASINTLLTTYAFGVQIEIDLNLADGTKVLASDLVAAGLYQSNQFYPAQKLTYAMTDYCAYKSTDWGGTWYGDEIGSCCFIGPDKNVMTVDPADPNKYIMDNFWGDGVTAYVIFTPSSNPDTQIVTLPKQSTSEGGEASGAGTYNSCLNTFTINTVYKLGGGTYEFIYAFDRTK